MKEWRPSRTPQAFALWIVILGGCSSPLRPCKTTEECTSAQACAGGNCVSRCSSNANCIAGEICSAEGACQKVGGNQTITGPTITSIEGTSTQGATRIAPSGLIKILGGNLDSVTSAKLMTRSLQAVGTLTLGSVSAAKIETIISPELEQTITASADGNFTLQVESPSRGVARAEVQILKGEKGDPGPAGSSTINCTPGETFCEAGKLWSCTKSGHDATPGGDCAVSCPSATPFCVGTTKWTCSKAGTGAYKTECVTAYPATTTNPGICSTTNCPTTDPGACCRPAKAMCKWNLTGPMAISGERYGSSCVSRGTCSTDSLSIYFTHNAGTCPTTSYVVSLSINGALATPGQVITLPNAAVSLSSYGNPGLPAYCSSWTGTVTWTSDVPSWAVSFNATCSEAGETAHTVVGTVSGDL